METTITMPRIEELDAFVRGVYTPELAGVIMDVVDILKSLEYPDIEEILLVENEDPEKQSLCFMDELIKAVKSALNQQGVYAETESLNDLSVLLAALYNAMTPESPELYQTVLNTRLSNEEILSTILEDFCHYTSETLMTLLTEVSDTTINLFRSHYTNLELRASTESVSEDLLLLRRNLKDFLKYTQGKETLASAMIAAGLPEGDVAAMYYGHLSKELTVIVNSENIEKVALQLLSYFYFCIDTFRNPIEIFNTVGEKLGVPARRTIEVQTAMVKVVSEFTQFKTEKEKHDTGTLSILQHPA